jgi:hypothetical protein
MEQHHPSPPSVRIRRLVRAYGVLVVIALAFLIMAVCVREKDRIEPAESLGSSVRTALTGLVA